MVVRLRADETDAPLRLAQHHGRALRCLGGGGLLVTAAVRRAHVKGEGDGDGLACAAEGILEVEVPVRGVPREVLHCLKFCTSVQTKVIIHGR